MPPKLDGSQAKVLDGATTHALIGSQARVVDSLKTYVGPVVTVCMIGTLMSHGGTASVATTSAEATVLFEFRGSRNSHGFCSCSTSAPAAMVSMAALHFRWLRLLRPVFIFARRAAAAAFAAGLHFRRLQRSQPVFFSGGGSY